MASAKLPQARLQHILEQIDGITTATQGLAFTQVDNNFCPSSEFLGQGAA